MENDNELYRALGSIEGKLDALITSTEAATKRHEALETRVRKLETWGARVAGALALLTFLLKYAF